MTTAIPPDRRVIPARWPWFVLAGFVLIAATGVAGIVANEESLAEQVPYVLAFGMFGAVGALILSRDRGNRIGALLLYGSTATAASFAAGELMTYLLRRDEAEGPVFAAAAVLSNIGWAVGILPVLFFLPLLFPDGRLPSARWRPLAWTCGATLVLLALGLVFAEPVLTASSEDVVVENPAFVPALEAFFSDVAVNVLLLGCLGGSVASLVVRFRRARGAQRQQIKWVVAALVFMVVSFFVSAVVSAAGGTDVVDTITSAAAFLAIPVAVGVSVLQYRLYELDVVVQKALIAGTLFLVVVGVYGAIVWLFGAVASERANSLSFFLIALLLGLAFRPATRLARRMADRLVYGRRATPYEVLTEFSGRVGEAYATEDVLDRMAQILGEGVGAGHARVWLLVGADLRPSSTWPRGAEPAEPIRVRGEEIPAIPGETVVEVRDRGEVLGALSVAMPPNDPMTPAREKLVRDLAAQAGLALRNVRLIEELRGSQRRLVTAQDQERRRIERNIHDGAQQQLVSLSVQLRLAQALVGRDPAKSEAMLEALQVRTTETLEDLRDLARGIYPPLLADKGLPSALEAQARKSPVPVVVDADGVGRLPQDVEGAVYFSVLEALQNVSKYAAANRATVTLRRNGEELTFVVEDDGRGFDAADVGYGTGLQGMADRLAALEGRLELRSEPGRGTAVTGRIPLEGPPEGE